MKVTYMDATLKQLIRLKELARNKADARGKAREEMEALRAGLPANVLRRFDHMTRHGRAPVARLSESGACGGCHMRLPQADALRIRSSSHGLPTCPFCGGFLYAPSGASEAGQQLAGAL